MSKIYRLQTLIPYPSFGWCVHYQIYFIFMLQNPQWPKFSLNLFLISETNSKFNYAMISNTFCNWKKFAGNYFRSTCVLFRYVFRPLIRVNNIESKDTFKKIDGVCFLPSYTNCVAREYYLQYSFCEIILFSEYFIQAGYE